MHQNNMIHYKRPNVSIRMNFSVPNHIILMQYMTATIIMALLVLLLLLVDSCTMKTMSFWFFLRNMFYFKYYKWIFILESLKRKFYFCLMNICPWYLRIFNRKKKRCVSLDFKISVTYIICGHPEVTTTYNKATQ